MDKTKNVQNEVDESKLNTASTTETSKEETISSTSEETKTDNESSSTSTNEEAKSTEEKKETENKDEKKAETNDEEKKEEEHPLVLKNLDLGLTYDVLSVPSCSGSEYRMVMFILMWARANKIPYEFDTYGNIYLTKGTLAEGEFYPCVTSHLDTVQKEQEAYAQCGVPLQLLERINTKGQHELYVADTGIGADDKAGVLISLNLFKYFDKLKACFFLEEERGCLGSKKLNKAWFDNVGYVIGWDSPDRNRAAYACSGELLMSKDFFESIKDTCKEHGVTNFKSEPFTDVKEIRSQTEVMCMNFGNGGYNAHASTEYVVLEDIDGALGLGIALIEKIGLTKHRMKSTTTWPKNSNDENVAYFEKIDPPYTYGYSSYNRNYSGNTNTNTNTSTGASKSTVVSSATKTEKDDTTIPYKTLEYTIERYEKHIENIQMKCETREEEILEDIKKLFEEGNATFDEVKKIFMEHPSAEPFSTAIEF